MIVEWFTSWIVTAIEWVAGFLPEWSPDMLDGWQMVLDHLTDLNYFLPIAEVFSVTLAAFLIFPALMGASLLVWLLALLRGGSSRG